MKQYHEYPQQYRSICYQFLLQFPYNEENLKRYDNSNQKPSYQQLPGYQLYQTTFPSNISQIEEQRINKLSQCLINWSPSITYCDWLGYFLLPIVRTFQDDLLSCLECSQILLNSFQDMLMFNNCLSNKSLYLINEIIQQYYQYDNQTLDMTQFLSLKTENNFLKNFKDEQQFIFKTITHLFGNIFQKEKQMKILDHIITCQNILFVHCILAVITTREMHLTYKQYIQAQNDVDEILMCAYEITRQLYGFQWNFNFYNQTINDQYIQQSEYLNMFKQYSAENMSFYIVNQNQIAPPIQIKNIQTQDVKQTVNQIVSQLQDLQPEKIIQQHSQQQSKQEDQSYQQLQLSQQQSQNLQQSQQQEINQQIQPETKVSKTQNVENQQILQLQNQINQMQQQIQQLSNQIQQFTTQQQLQQQNNNSQQIVQQTSQQNKSNSSYLSQQCKNELQQNITPIQIDNKSFQQEQQIQDQNVQTEQQQNDTVKHIDLEAVNVNDLQKQQQDNIVQQSSSQLQQENDIDKIQIKNQPNQQQIQEQQPQQNISSDVQNQNNKQQQQQQQITLQPVNIAQDLQQPKQLDLQVDQNEEEQLSKQIDQMIKQLIYQQNKMIQEEETETSENIKEQQSTTSKIDASQNSQQQFISSMSQSLKENQNDTEEKVNQIINQINKNINHSLTSSINDTITDSGDNNMRLTQIQEKLRKLRLEAAQIENSISSIQSQKMLSTNEKIARLEEINRQLNENINSIESQSQNYQFSD